MLGISVLGVLFATLAGMLLGALWYSPLLFGNHWLRCIGKTSEQLGSTTIPMLGSVLANLLTAVGVSLLFLFFGVNSLQEGVCIGLVLGGLIIFPALLSDNLFCGWGYSLLLIQSCYRLLAVLLMSIVLVYFS